MKVTAKIFILVMAISLAIGGVMMYAKTKVDPPMATKSIDQFSECLTVGIASLNSVGMSTQEDSLFVALTEKARFFVSEGRLTKEKGNTDMDLLGSTYAPLFLKRSMDKFRHRVWYDTDHRYMLSVMEKLRSMRDFDNAQVLSKQNLDSLALVENIISNYRQARKISRHTTYIGVSDAQTTINKAGRFAKDPYLAYCTDLVNALNNVKPAIAASHYNYVSEMVGELSQYTYYSQSYYDDVLVPRVDAAVTEYENKASDLYGTKRDVNTLWSRARSYYNSASEYYNSRQTR